MSKEQLAEAFVNILMNGIFAGSKDFVPEAVRQMAEAMADEAMRQFEEYEADAWDSSSYAC
jgi:hypothetical protein